MNHTAQQHRVVILLTAISLLFTAFACRLVQLHVLRHRELAATALKNREQLVHRQGKRGAVLDCHGNLLANSQFVRIITADPSITASNAPQLARQLAPLLKLDEAALIVRLSGPGRYVRLKQKVDEETVAQIAALKLRGIFTEPQFIRSYPNNELAAHVLGFVDAQHRGVQGIEAAMEDYLQGRAGYEIIERDRKGREIRVLRQAELSPRDGYNVVLTLDQVIQHITETALDKAMAEFKPQAAVAIVSRPRTGEILAMACRPTFDPNQPGAAEADARRNRAISDVAEPGSTFKVVSIAAALNEGIVSLSDQFDCENGAFLYAGRVLHDAHPYGVLSVKEIIFHSSNIGAAKIALRLGAPRLADYIRRFGFGRKTGIALPGEVAGIAHPLARWSALSITRIPMGHEIAATPLQMLMALNAIANGGYLMKPLIVKSVLDADGQPVIEYAPQLIGSCISPRASVLMAAALREVVGPNGTGARARVEHYDVAGKTGTAQKIENGQYVRKYYSSFIGYLPASDPQLSILVSLDDPSGGAYYGGTVAGPVFREIAEKTVQYLGIPPQQPAAEPSTVRNVS